MREISRSSPKILSFKLLEDHPNLKKNVLLAISVKAINDTLGPKSIIPSVLVFGEFPSIRALIEQNMIHATLSERKITTQETCKLM